MSDFNDFDKKNAMDNDLAASASSSEEKTTPVVEKTSEADIEYTDDGERIYYASEILAEDDELKARAYGDGKKSGKSSDNSSKKKKRSKKSDDKAVEQRSSKDKAKYVKSAADSANVVKNSGENSSSKDGSDENSKISDAMADKIASKDPDRLSEDDKIENGESKNVKDNSSKRKLTKQEKKRIKSERAAAIKALNEQKKKIKRGGSSFDIPGGSGKKTDVDYYGERLPYPGGFPVYCSKYVVISDRDPHVALRFFNASDATVTGLKFAVVEKNEKGAVIATSKLERGGLFAECSTEFAVADVAVSADCVQVEIKIEVVQSEPYEYILDSDGEATLRYGMSDSTSDKYFKDERTVKITKRRRGYVLISLLAVILMAAAAVFTALEMGLMDRVFPPSENGTESIYEINGGELYVEA